MKVNFPTNLYKRMKLLLCPVFSIIAIHFCMVSRTLTSPNSNVFRIDWPNGDKVSSIYWQRSTASLPSLVVIKHKNIVQDQFVDLQTLSEKQLVYLHSMLAASLPSCSLRSNKGINLSVPRVKTNTGA